MKKATLYLSDLKPGMTGEVLSLPHSGSIHQRLMDLGLVEGSRVTCLGRSLWGDPAAYEICGAVIALRRADCEQILLREMHE